MSTMYCTREGRSRHPWCLWFAFCLVLSMLTIPLYALWLEGVDLTDINSEMCLFVICLLALPLLVRRYAREIDRIKSLELG